MLFASGGGVEQCNLVNLTSMDVEACFVVLVYLLKLTRLVHWIDPAYLESDPQL
jgi:hypothetical protein